MRRTAFHIALAAAAAALPAPLIAQAAAPVCLTPREVTALSTYALPSAIGGVSRNCAASLPAGGWLQQNGAALAQRYSGSKAQAWPQAKAAFLKMSTATNPDAAQLFAALPDESLMPLADAALAGIVASKVKPESCPTIDRALALLSPLPAENAAELIALAVGIGAKAGEPRLGKFALCKA